MSNFACEIYRYFGLIDEAIAAGERGLQLDPTFAYEPLLVALYRELGRFDDAIALYEKSQNISGRAPFGLAITYAKMNLGKQAKEILKAACASRGSYNPGDAIAHVHVVLGEHEDAIRELQRAYEEHSSSLHFIGIAPEFAALRPDKRFISIVRQTGLEPEKVSRRVSPQRRLPSVGAKSADGWKPALADCLLHDHVVPVAMGTHAVVLQIVLRDMHSKEQNRYQTEIEHRHDQALRRSHLEVAPFFFGAFAE